MSLLIFLVVNLYCSNLLNWILRHTRMTEKSFTNTIEHFLEIAKSLNDLDSHVDLIKKVVESPVIYSFSELLEVPLIASVIY